MNNPYQSIIITGRNDNYGGDFTHRLQNFITWNTALLEKYKLPTEIIFVNWNPIPENKSIKESINWPKNRNYVNYRLIDVSNDIHKTFINEKIRKTVALFEFIAKNVGIRRAKGDFILTTNADILISEAIIKNIARKNLKNDTYYRANRFDFKQTKELKLREIQKNIYLIHLKGYSYKIKPSQYTSMHLLKFKCINFFNVLYSLHSSKFDKLLNKLGLPVIYDNYSQKFHTLFSGDFIMTNKSNFISLKGFEEETWISTHVDAHFVAKCYYSKLKETTFLAPIYHQNHNRRFEDSLKNEAPDSKKMFEYFRKSSQEMENKKLFLTKNLDNWGLDNVVLDEIVL